MSKLEQAAREVIRQHSMECLSDKTVDDLREALDEQAECKKCDAKQAQIDRLMLEFCPDEMTAEQLGEWGSNQKPVSQEPVKREHITDGSPCWCNPELNYKDPETGAEVWIHQEPQ